MDEGVARIEAADRPAAIATVVDAFAADPVERWLWPADGEYARHFPVFAEAFGGRAFEGGTAWQIEGLAGVALWLGPGVEADEEAVGAALLGSVAEPRHEELLAILAQMTEAHPTAPHWYLPWLAVGPARQGDGLGGRLLAATLATVDEDRLPAFLETPNPRTVGFYERHGFEVVAVTSSPSCPPLTSMLRPVLGRARAGVHA
ncbi:MAG TPA: GNAT family N-acetyltransferase [Solirubrobacterales bacterium]|nr:GNAT family N-acetyltransferase [Solirubrobacterales bacterium]